MTRPSAIALLLCAATGCSFHARDAASYRKDTRALLSTKDADIKSCYDAELKKNPTVSGSVVVKFKVEKETGKITGAKLDQATNAPESLGQCVVNAIDGLSLQPPDARDGDATFLWQFQVKS
jgi:hypothetical protein